MQITPLNPGDPTSLGYQWVRMSDSLPADSVRPLGGATMVAPPSPGFYRLSVVRVCLPPLRAHDRALPSRLFRRFDSARASTG